MAIVTSMPQQENEVVLYDIPDAELQKYKVEPSKAAQMFPEKEKPTGIASNEGAMSKTAIDNADSLQGEDVQAYYHRICICRQLWCNAYTCWWHYYYCWC